MKALRFILISAKLISTSKATHNAVGETTISENRRKLIKTKVTNHRFVLKVNQNAIVFIQKKKYVASKNTAQ
jgi:hypothetical protein